MTEMRYESPPEDLLIRRAFELPRTRRRRHARWEQWKKEHWHREGPSVRDPAAPEEIELYAEVLSAAAAFDRPLNDDELDEVLGVHRETSARASGQPEPYRARADLAKYLQAMAPGHALVVAGSASSGKTALLAKALSALADASTDEAHARQTLLDLLARESDPRRAVTVAQAIAAVDRTSDDEAQALLEFVIRLRTEAPAPRD